MPQVNLWVGLGEQAARLPHLKYRIGHHNSHVTRPCALNLNGEIRDREKVMRGLERKDSPLLTGNQLFHNYIRPHMGLKGKTPAEVAGIRVDGLDKWLTIIQNASKR